MACEPVIITTNNVIISFPFHLHITSLHMTQHTQSHTHAGMGTRLTLGPIYFTLTMTLNSLSKASEEGDKNNRITQLLLGLHSIVKCIFIV